MSALRVTILSCSLRAESRSCRLAHEAARLVRESGDKPVVLDMREIAPPPFDDDAAFAHPAYPHLHSAIAKADSVVVAAPVYNWGLGGATRNVIELTGATSEAGLGAAWFDKVVTFLCAGGTPQSYMAYGATALSLMLDFKCVVNPYVTYATDVDWTADGKPCEALAARLGKTMAVQAELAQALRDRRFRSGWEI